MNSQAHIAPADFTAALGRASKLGILSVVTLRALVFIADHGSPKMSDVSDHVGLSSAAITGMMDRLAEQGFIERYRQDGDRRMVYLRLADKGADALTEILAA